MPNGSPAVGGTKKSLCESSDGEIVFDNGPFDKVTDWVLVVSLPKYIGQLSFAIPIFRICVSRDLQIFVNFGLFMSKDKYNTVI